MEKESPASAALPVDNTDWLKSAAMVPLVIDHFGYFFMADDLWSSVIGRLVAPVFFFLLGYARTTTVPHRWIWLGVVLTALESWNAGWNWVVPNILLSFALIRIARPHVDKLLQRHGWFAFGLLISALIALLGVAASIVDYGAEGWLWALFGYCQRMYVDGRSTAGVAGAKRVVACLVAAAIFVWQEQEEYGFPPIAFAAVILGVGVVTLCLFLFRRGPGRVQPPEAMARVLRFTGRHTLEIYALQLGLSEIIVKLIPSYAA